jgi:2-octaprenyl-6-methoxyphenol hydroxylase
VRIGNAAHTLHPVAGQGLNLALRDVHELVRQVRDAESVPAALRRFERNRAADRWSTLAVTDVLARAFTWRWPLVGTARSVGLAAMEGVSPVKSVLARQMMFGVR